MPRAPFSVAVIVGVAMAALVGFASVAAADATDAALRERSREVLRHELATTGGWVRVHAAEALIDHGETAGLAAVYARELATATPPYRIGVWRVLARAAPTAADRQRYLGSIRAAFRDVTAPDRVHAAETLAKLSAAEPADRAVIDRWLATADAPTSAYLLWLRVQLDPPATRRAAEAGLAALLGSEAPAARLRAAYALARLSPLAPATAALIASALTREPAGSPARAYLLVANLAPAPQGEPAQGRADLKSELRGYLAHGTPGEQLEVALAFGRLGHHGDVPALAALLTAPDPDARIGGASGLLHLLR